MIAKRAEHHVIVGWQRLLECDRQASSDMENRRDDALVISGRSFLVEAGRFRDLTQRVSERQLRSRGAYLAAPMQLFGECSPVVSNSSSGWRRVR